MSDLSENLHTNKEESIDLTIQKAPASDKSITIDKFTTILERILPHISHDEDKIISAQVILGLKLEGILGETITEQQSHMIEMIKESILQSDEKRESSLLLAQRIIDKLEL